MGKIREGLRRLKADKREDAAMRVRMKYIERWMKRTEEITGKPCLNPQEIAYDD